MRTSNIYEPPQDLGPLTPDGIDQVIKAIMQSAGGMGGFLNMAQNPFQVHNVLGSVFVPGGAPFVGMMNAPGMDLANLFKGLTPTSSFGSFQNAFGGLLH